MKRSSVFALLVLLGAVVGCPDQNCPPNAPCPTATPGSSGCSNLTGSRNSFFSDSCGRSGSGVMVISQSGCSFNGNLPGLGAFTGTASGTTLQFTITFSDPCAGTATGTGTVLTGSVNGTYSGTQSGAAGTNCCSPVMGNFSFDFAPTPVTTATPTPVARVFAPRR